MSTSPGVDSSSHTCQSAVKPYLDFRRVAETTMPTGFSPIQTSMQLSASPSPGF